MEDIENFNRTRDVTYSKTKLTASKTSIQNKHSSRL